MKSCGRSLGGVSSIMESVKAVYGPGNELTHEGRKTFDFNLLSHNEPAAPLLTGWFANNRNGILRRLIGTQAPRGAGWGCIAVI